MTKNLRYRIILFSCRRAIITALFCILVSTTSGGAVFAGDSFYGKVTQVRSANTIILENERAKFNVRIAGIDVPKQRLLAAEAREFLARLVLRKNARLRLGYRERTGVFVGRLQTDDPEIGLKDVAVELVRAGLAQKQANFDYKYGELAAAEKEARAAKRGLWSGGK